MDEFELCRFIKTDSEMGCMTCLQNQRTQGTYFSFTWTKTFFPQTGHQHFVKFLYISVMMMRKKPK